MTTLLKPLKLGAPVYAPFHALNKYVGYVTEHGVPEIVDTEVLTDIGETVRTHLLSGLRYLDLITDDRRPTETLFKLSKASEDERKEVYQEILNSRYAFILKDHSALEGLTLEVLRQRFEDLEISGSTVKKCISFFLELSRHVGWQMEQANSQTRQTPQVLEPPKNTAAAPNGSHSSNDAIKTIRLASAGTLTLTLNVNLLELRGEDRNFVFNLIDQLQDYEGKAKPASG